MGNAATQMTPERWERQQEQAREWRKHIRKVKQRKDLYLGNIGIFLCERLGIPLKSRVYATLSQIERGRIPLPVEWSAFLQEILELPDEVVAEMQAILPCDHPSTHEGEQRFGCCTPSGLPFDDYRNVHVCDICRGIVWCEPSAVLYAPIEEPEHEVRDHGVYLVYLPRWKPLLRPPGPDVAAQSMMFLAYTFQYSQAENAFSVKLELPKLPLALRPPSKEELPGLSKRWEFDAAPKWLRWDLYREADIKKQLREIAEELR